MEAISHKSGKVFTGKLAAFMLRIGAARPVGEPKVVKVVKPKAAAKPKVKK